MLLGWGDQFVPSSLKGSTIAVLFELKNDADEFLGSVRVVHGQDQEGAAPVV